MRKNYKLKLFTALVVAGVSIGSANAFNPNPTSSIIAENSDNWVEMKNENGITISYLETSSNSKESNPIYLKFFNGNSEKVIFTWSLNDKDGKVISSSKDKSVVIEPGQSLGNTEMVAWLSSYQNPMDLSINITLLKK